MNIVNRFPPRGGKFSRISSVSSLNGHKIHRSSTSLRNYCKYQRLIWCTGRLPLRCAKLVGILVLPCIPREIQYCVHSPLNHICKIVVEEGPKSADLQAKRYSSEPTQLSVKKPIALVKHTLTSIPAQGFQRVRRSRRCIDCMDLVLLCNRTHQHAGS